MAQFPTTGKGTLVTHFNVASDIGRSRRFYAGVLGGEVPREGEPSIIVGGPPTGAVRFVRGRVVGIPDLRRVAADRLLRALPGPAAQFLHRLRADAVRVRLVRANSAHSPPVGQRGRAARDRRDLVRRHGRLRPRRASEPVRRHAHPAPAKLTWWRADPTALKTTPGTPALVRRQASTTCTSWIRPGFRERAANRG
jgi:hypothetical protein